MTAPDDTAAETTRPDHTRRGPSRRALLTGSVAVAGLAVGAGGTQLANAATSSSAPSVGPHLASPGEELMIEHGVLKRLLLVYRAVHDRLATGRTTGVHVLVDAAQMMSDYVEGFHEGLEEAYVFPRVASAEPELIRTLLVQHDRGRHLTAAIQDALGGDLSRPTTRSALASHLAAFVRMYEPHEAWEDTVVYPALREMTPQRTLDELAERFADLENAEYGDAALHTMLQRIGGVEQQLGLQDLNSFTPAPL